MTAAALRLPWEVELLVALADHCEQIAEGRHDKAWLLELARDCRAAIAGHLDEDVPLSWAAEHPELAAWTAAWRAR